jgi:hypothetical protein
MNVVDQFLGKVGKQTLLTSKAMMYGYLPEEEAEELERLRAIDFEIDMQTLSMWERHAQNGYFRTMFDATGINRITTPELAKFLNALTQVEIKYEISSIDADLARWVEIITILNSAVKGYGVTQEQVNAILYYYFVVSGRLTVHPTSPSILRATIPTFISEGVDFSEGKDELNTNINQFLNEKSQTELIGFASHVFQPSELKRVASSLFNETNIATLDKERDKIIDTIDECAKKRGFIDYRQLLVSMYLTQIRFALENEVEK